MLKIPKIYKKSRLIDEQAFTLVELIVTFALVSLLTMLGYLFINPPQMRARGRDEQRLSDINTLERIIIEFNVDNNTYPDVADTLRVSTILPGSSTGPLENVSSGWIAQDLSFYNSILPTDPINDATYFYSYQHNGSSYELNAQLEYYTEFSINTYDGGDDGDIYEVGGDLTIL